MTGTRKFELFFNNMYNNKVIVIITTSEFIYL